MLNYVVTEQAPTTTAYIRSGRGGAGNMHRVSASTPRATSHTVSSSTTVPRRFFSGIGGAGNAHQANERPALTLEEEYNRAAARDQARAGHCGIGGAGNVFYRKASDASSIDSAACSDSSSMTTKSKMWERFSGSFSRH